MRGSSSARISRNIGQQGIDFLAKLLQAPTITLGNRACRFPVDPELQSQSIESSEGKLPRFWRMLRCLPWRLVLYTTSITSRLRIPGGSDCLDDQSAIPLQFD